MKQHKGTYLHVLDRNRLPDGTELLHVNELPPPYAALATEVQSDESDWKEIIIDIQRLTNHRDKYGFAISGGIDTEDGPPIVITHIEYCSRSSFDNGRTKLCLFDRICSIDGINVSHVTHEEATRAFSSAQGQSISLQIRRLDPKHIEHIQFIMPSNRSNQALGITLNGGLDSNVDDPGLFISQIDPNGFLASVTKNNQLRLGDRLLEIKTNSTSANLRWVTRSKGGQLIRRTCQDNMRVTLIVAHRTV